MAVNVKFTPFDDQLIINPIKTYLKDRRDGMGPWIAGHKFKETMIRIYGRKFPHIKFRQNKSKLHIYMGVEEKDFDYEFQFLSSHLPIFHITPDELMVTMPTHPNPAYNHILYHTGYKKITEVNLAHIRSMLRGVMNRKITGRWGDGSLETLVGELDLLVRNGRRMLEEDSESFKRFMYAGRKIITPMIKRYGVDHMGELVYGYTLNRRPAVRRIKPYDLDNLDDVVELAALVLGHYVAMTHYNRKLHLHGF